MSPLFFRGSILVSEGVLSFTEFQEMRYIDFTKLEATHYFMLKVKNGNTAKTADSEKEKTKEKLMGLDTVHIDDLGLSKEYYEIF